MLDEFPATSVLSMPPGMRFAWEVMTPDEEMDLVALMEGSGLRYYAADPDNPRSSTSYGWKYDFRDDSFIACAPIPDGLKSLAAKAAAFAGIAAEDLAECLLNRYEEGAIIQWHLDKPVWEHVIGVSLGSATDMRFRKPLADGHAYATARLDPRSLYLLSGEARWTYQHSLPPMEGTRWSITFRSFSQEGLRLLDRAGERLG